MNREKKGFNFTFILLVFLIESDKDTVTTIELLLKYYFNNIRNIFGKKIVRNH